MDVEAAKVEITPQKYDAIHRALLTGLLGNIGTKTDAHEYTGARGTKFHIFPGSALFAKKPQWIVAGEIVETARLYARTVARIQPQWIERIAEHLVERSYSEPHWQSATAHVVAYEKVTLYGLVIVPRRLVHYGPIRSEESRTIFIHHALVEGDFRTDAPFMKHNRRLIAEIEQLEAKERRRDLLVDAQMRYAFYDARIPQGIYNGPLFEKWRREAEKSQPRLLFMTREALMRHGGAAATPEQYPDTMEINGMRLPLTYALAPGEPQDGVTATVPLAAVNQLPEAPFEWLVPGMLAEKIVALIRSLPKHLRTSFVPAPDYAARAAAMLTDRKGSLLEALARALGKVSGRPIAPRDFQIDALPAHLRMNFRVVDASGNELAMGRDLDEIRRQIGAEARSTFAEAPSSEFTRDGITRWDFGDLPQSVEVRRHGMTLQGYPALVDQVQTVSLRLLDSPEAADAAMRGGLRRLLMIQLSEEFKRLARSLPGLEQMTLHHATIGPGEQLTGDLMLAIADRAFFAGGDELLRTREQFIERAEHAWRRLEPSAREVAEIVGQSLAAYHVVATALARPTPPMWAPSIQDMRQQLAHLLPRGFVSRTPPQWLGHLPRFVKGIDVRLRKLANAGLTRDTQQLAIVRPMWQQYLDRAEKHRKLGIVDPALEQYRWMLEELRISLFAQELKTSMPISVQRLEKQWALVEP